MESGSDAHIVTDPVTSAACPKCGAMLDVDGLPAFTQVQCPTCEFEFQVPARFGSFMLLQLLGAGGMGGVYRARDEGLNREVAIKVMLKSLGDDPQFVETFQREAQAAARLNHPHIAQIYSFGQVHGQPFIVMELVSGGSLDKMMAAQGPMDPASVIHIGAQIADGLREAADAGLVHGDVKPENILFDNDKNAKLVDFGLAALQGGPGNDVWGTPFYIAPEKVRRQKSDFRSDIYSLGATLYHAIAGVPPFDGPDATAVVKARFDGPPKTLKEVRGNAIPAEVDEMISRMLEVEPQTRFPTYGSLLGDMRRYLAKAGPIQLITSSKKIMIKGKGPKNTTGVASSTGVMSPVPQSGIISSVVVPDGMIPIDQIEEDAEEGGKRFNFDYKKIAIWAGGVVAGVLVLSGVIAGCMHYNKVQKQKAEVAQIEARQAKARASIAKSVAEAKRIADKVRTYVPEAMACAKAAADEAIAVFGEGVRAAVVPPEPAAGVAPAAAAPAAANASSNAPAAAPAPAAPAEPAATGDENHPLVVSVRGIYETAYAIKAASAMADACVAEVGAAATAAEKMKTLEQVGALAKLAAEQEAKVAGLSRAKEILVVQQNLQAMRKSLSNVKSGAAAVVATKRAEAQDKEKKAKDAAVAEKKRQEQEALKEKAQSEIARVTATEEANLALLKELKFRDANRALKDLTDGLETKGGLDALAVAQDRVARLESFHKYLVEKAVGYKSSRGWSIEAADAKTLTVATKKITWLEVFGSRPEIVAELINGLVMDEAATKNLRLREKTALVTNAALCLSLFYRDMTSAQERAKQLAVKAAQDFSADAEVIKRLLPAFFTE